MKTDAIDYSARYIFESDGSEETDVTLDPFRKFLEPPTNPVGEKLFREAHGPNSPFWKTSRPISAPATHGGDWDEKISNSTLEKRASATSGEEDDLSGYRAWFAEGKKLGKNAGEMVDEWLISHPIASDEVLSALRKTAAEFS